MKLLKIYTLCLLLALLLCGCGGEATGFTEPPVITLPTRPQVTEPQETTSPMELVEELAMVAEPVDFPELRHYTNLKKLDLTGSTCYRTILEYMEEHPEVEVLYTVSLGGLEIPNTQTSLVLEPGSFDYSVLVENLPYLPQLTALSLPGTTLAAGELAAIQDVRPDLSLTYTVSLLGTEYPMDTTELDLSFLTPTQVQEAAPALAKFPSLDYVELMNDEGQSNLSKQDVKVLVDAAPNTNFHYIFTLFGKTLSTTDERVDYKKHSIGNEGEDELRAALDIMTGCTYFKLEDCGLDNEVLAQLRDDYRDKGIKIVWRIYFGKYSVLTDTEKIRAVYNVFDSTCHDLRYCEDVKYIDMGHNDTLTDLSFIGYMPNLEILIASGCSVKELSGFENCKKLEWLELANCSYLTDISALAGCESLRFLNISYTKVTDLMPLDGLPLERFVCKRPHVSSEEQEIFSSIHEGCIIRFYDNYPVYGYGWRYDDNGKTYSEYYLKIREIFGYDNMIVD